MINRKTTMKRRKMSINRKRRKGRSGRYRWFKKKNRGGIMRKDLRDAKIRDKKYNPRTSIRTTTRRKRKCRRRTVANLEKLGSLSPAVRRDTIRPRNFWRIPWDSENPLGVLLLN